MGCVEKTVGFGFAGLSTICLFTDNVLLRVNSSNYEYLVYYPNNSSYQIFQWIILINLIN